MFWSWLARILGAVLVAVLFGLILVRAGLRAPYSPSIPYGLYWLEEGRLPEESGELFMFCLPADFGRLAVEKGWMHSGTCPGGEDQMGKYVVGLPGQAVERIAGDLYRVGDLELELPLSEEGEWDEVWTGVLSGYWAYSAHPRGIDSRYYGPIPVGQVHGVLRPLWTRPQVEF